LRWLQFSGPGAGEAELSIISIAAWQGWQNRHGVNYIEPDI
jgi:hypothetical protein